MYEYSQIKEANSIVNSHMNQIREASHSEIFDSLVLFGAYGKGEGGFHDGKPVNDYDLLVINGDEKLEEKLKGLDLPIEVEVHRYSTGEAIACTQQWWEIAHASKLLEGKPLSLPAWEQWDIPFDDAINSLDRRVVSFLVAKYEMGKEEPNEYKAMTQIGKMVIALGDAVLIKRGEFSPSYRTRALMLKQDSISPLYDIAVGHKVLGSVEPTTDELWMLWQRTRSYFRDYVMNTHIATPYTELLVNFDERVSQEALKELLVNMGAERWL